MTAKRARAGGDGGAAPGTTSSVWAAALASGAIVATHVAGKATRDTLFLAHFGLALLPAAMIGAALVSSLAVLGFSRALARYSPARLVPAIFGIAAVLFLLEWALSLRSERAAAIAVYVHTAVFGSVTLSAFWSLVNERFDPHEAKKVVGRIASGGTLGGVLGGVVVWRASEHLSVPMMLALLAGMQVVGLYGSLRAAGPQSPRPPAIATSARGERRENAETEGALSGVGVVQSTPYLRDLALLVLAGAVIQALLDWLLGAHASERYGKGPTLLAFFALYNMVVGVASFAAQTGLARPALERLGLAGTVKWQPLTVAIFGGFALVAPQLTAVVALRGAEAVMRNSLYRSAYELFYTPIATHKKRATKTLIDVGVDRIGTTVGSVVLLVIVQLGPGFATRAVLIVSIAMAAASYFVCARLKDGYVEALASSLKSGAVALDDDDPQDLTTRKTLAETTALLDREKLLARIEQFQRAKEARGSDPAIATGASGDPAEALASTMPDLTGASAEPRSAAIADPLLARAAVLRSGTNAQIKSELVAPLPRELAGFAVDLLANDAVVRDVVRALRKIAPKATGELLDALLDPDVDPRVRRRIPRVLKACRSQRAASGMLLALVDPVFEVRVQVALALTQMHEEAGAKLDRDEVFDAVVHELTKGRASWSVETEPALVRDGRSDVPPDDHGGPEPDPSTITSSRSSPPRSGDASTGGRDEVHRGLAHVFTVLGLALEREPLAIAYRALRSEEAALRGTAYEYLEVVLPERVRAVVVPMLGDVKPAAERARDRGSKELADELLRSSAALTRAPSRAR